MAKVTYYLTNSYNLNNIEVKPGNLIFCENTKTIYLDSASGRIAYDSITVFETDADRYNLVAPERGFYYVEETKVLWRYDEYNWSPLTEPPTNNVVFIPKNELPQEGEPAVLYICGKDFYIWNIEEHQYEKMNASEIIWNEI